MNPDAAYVMGLLHDIGRREGIMDMRHIYAGYLFMSSLGYDDSARICLTHCFCLHYTRILSQKTGAIQKHGAEKASEHY